jgi:hypothetical protein
VAHSHPEWIHEKVENAFEKFVEQKWMDSLNIAAAEPGSREAGEAEQRGCLLIGPSALPRRLQ